MKLIQGIEFYKAEDSPTISKEYENWYGSSLIIEVTGGAGYDVSIEGKIVSPITEWTKLALYDLATLGVVTSITSSGLYAINIDGIRSIRANNGGAGTAVNIIGRITDTPLSFSTGSGGGGGGTPGKDGKDGKDGSLWYVGTAITGTSTTPTSYNTGIANAKVSDIYLNTDTGDTYQCTVGGNQTTAKWIYISNLKGPAGGVDEETKEKVEDLETRVGNLEEKLEEPIILDGNNSANN